MRQLFIADLHLQPERPEISRALLYFLEQIAPGADELYLLGDIFEFWIGDDSPLPGLEAVINALRTCADRGTRMFFQHGNRDFLVGEGFLHNINAQLLPEQQLIDTACGRALIMHGDQLCTDDTDYQQFRRQVRATEWQQHFLAQPVETRLAIARELRQKSSAEGAMKSLDIMDVNPAAVSRCITQAQVKLLIHGHTHRPAIHTLPAEAERIVLGDWSDCGWYLQIDNQGRELIRFSPSTDDQQRTQPQPLSDTNQPPA